MTRSTPRCWPGASEPWDLGLEGRIAIVTGGASNIGRAISQTLAAEGAIVAILDRDEAMARRTASEIVAAAGACTPYVADLTDVAATAAATASIEADLGPVAVLVNNVGWNGTAEFYRPPSVPRSPEPLSTCWPIPALSRRGLSRRSSPPSRPDARRDDRRRHQPSIDLVRHRRDGVDRRPDSGMGRAARGMERDRS